MNSFANDNNTRRSGIVVTALAVAVVALACLCLLIGSVDIPAMAVFDILAGRGCGNPADPAAKMEKNR